MAGNMWQVTMKYNHAYLVYRLTIIATFNVCGGGYSVQFLLGGTVSSRNQ